MITQGLLVLWRALLTKGRVPPSETTSQSTNLPPPLTPFLFGICECIPYLKMLWSHTGTSWKSCPSPFVQYLNVLQRQHILPTGASIQHPEFQGRKKMYIRLRSVTVVLNESVPVFIFRYSLSYSSLALLKRTILTSAIEFFVRYKSTFISLFFSSSPKPSGAVIIAPSS